MARYASSDVVIRDFPPTSVARLRHRGDPHRLRDTIRRFVRWRRENGFRKGESDTFTVFHNTATDPDRVFEVDLCCAVTRAIRPNDDGVVADMIAGGRCAVLRVIGNGDDLSAPAGFLYRDWLPGSDEDARNFPLFCQRLELYPDVPEGETVTDLFLPICQVFRHVFETGVTSVMLRA